MRDSRISSAVFFQMNGFGFSFQVAIHERRSASSACTERCVGLGDDPLSGRLLRFGPTGFELNPNPSSLGPPDDAFGHTGAGGSSHGAWPSQGVGFSYLTNFGRPENADGRARALLEALHASL